MSKGENRIRAMDANWFSDGFGSAAGRKTERLAKQRVFQFYTTDKGWTQFSQLIDDKNVTKLIVNYVGEIMYAVRIVKQRVKQTKSTYPPSPLSHIRRFLAI